MKGYLENSEYIDWPTSGVRANTRVLASERDSDEAIAKYCFQFVRDEVKHSWDFRLNPVTSRASEVLEYGTGYCYAKSHLLTALCYQRLTIENDTPPFCLHGLNAV